MRVLRQSRQKITPPGIKPPFTVNTTIIKTTLTTLIAAAFAIGIGTSVAAAPPGKGTGVFKSAAPQEDVQKLKKGDRYAIVCMFIVPMKD